MTTLTQVLEALKKVARGMDAFDVFIFCLVFIIFPPLPLIWLVVRVLQEWE